MPKKEVRSIRDLMKKHAGRWLAIEVVERDSGGQPKTGAVVAVAPTRLEAHQKVRRRRDICLLYAGPQIPKGFGSLF